MERNKILLLVIGLALVGYFLYSGGFSGIGIGEPRNKVSCTVSVHNPVTSDIFTINSASCNIIGECSGSFFTVGENIAKVRLLANGKIVVSDSIEIEDFLGGNGQIVLIGCVPQSVMSGTIEIRNSENTLTDSMNVNF